MKSNYSKLSNNFSIGGALNNQRNKLIFNDQSESNEIKVSIENTRNEIIQYIDTKLNEINKVNTIIIGMLKAMREDQKFLIQEKAVSSNVINNVKHNQEFLNNYYTPNGKADELFSSLMIQKEFSQIRKYQ
jgi:hypothetical protein